MYRPDGDDFSRHVVDELRARHVKEILLADVEGAGRPNLYVALEGQLGRSAIPDGNEDDVEIKEDRFTQEGLGGVSIATLPDNQCRFLKAGDVDADGISTTPGVAFGPTGERNLRLSLCVAEERIDKAFDSMEAFLK
jgi:hypothetical protein